MSERVAKTPFASEDAHSGLAKTGIAGIGTSFMPLLEEWT
jgi:hypothetical protein